MRRYIGLSAIIFLVFLAGCNTVDDRTPATTAPPVNTPTVEATPSAVPLGVETSPTAVPLGVEGNAPTGVWAPPSFLDATSWGDATGGRSPEVVDPYIQAVGERFGDVGYSANKGGDRWVAVGVDSDGGVFWAYDPETGRMREYPTYFTLSAGVDESVDYRVVPGSENAVLGWLGETAEGKPGGFPTLLKNGRPKTLTINGEETSATEYTTFLNTTTGEWQLRPDIAPNGMIALEDGVYRVNPETGEYEVVLEDYAMALEAAVGLAATLGETRVNEENGQIEVWVGEGWVSIPNSDIFDASQLRIAESGEVKLIQPGLQVKWDVEANDWRVLTPSEAELPDGTMTFLFGEGGRIAFDQEKAKVQYERTILAYVNGPGNSEWRQAIFGSANQLTIDQLPVVEAEDGSSKRVMPVIDNAGNEAWPQIMILDGAYIEFHPLHIYLDEGTKETVRSHGGIDVTTLPVHAIRIDDWETNRNGIMEQYNPTSGFYDGPTNPFGVSWFNYGFTIDRETGMLVVYAGSRSLAPNGGGIYGAIVYEYHLGGEDGDVVDPYMVEAYLGSLAKVFEVGSSKGTALPLDPHQFSGYAGVTESDMNDYVEPGLVQLVNPQ